MKKIITLFLTIMISNLLVAQGMHGRYEHMRKKIRQLEKLKLLETLNLDEETAIRFFSRRNKFLEEQKNILKERKELIKEAEQLLKERKGDYDYIINSMKKIEKDLVEKRSAFLDSVNDILTKEQIVKMIILEYKFKQEIKNILMKRGKRKFMKENFKEP